MNHDNPSKQRVYYDLLTRVGNHGKYQKKAMMIFFMIALLGASTFFVSTYLFYQQPYLSNGVQSTACSRHVCSLPSSQRTQYQFPQIISTLGNQNSDLNCQSISSVTTMMEAILLGGSIGLFLGVVVAGYLGRKNTVLLSLLAALVGNIIVLIFSNIKIRCIGLFLWGLGAEVSYTVSASYITEIVAQSDRSAAYVFFNAAYAGGTIANAIVFYILKNWILVLSLYYSLLYLLTSLCFWSYVQKPPIQIISHNKESIQAYKAFIRIAERNQTSNHGITYEQIEELHEEYNQNQKNNNHAQYFTFVDICRYRSVRIDFFKVTLTFFINIFILFGIPLLMAKLFSNIFISGLVNGLSQFATIPFLPYFNKNVSRRRGLMWMFGMNALFTLLQFIINPSGGLNYKNEVATVFLLIFFFIARFFINLVSNFFVCTNNQSFPAQMRSICHCGVVGVGRLSSLIIPFLPKLKQSLSISYDLIFVFAGILGVIASYMLRETVDIPPPEIIEELQMQEEDDSGAQDEVEKRENRS